MARIRDKEKAKAYSKLWRERNKAKHNSDAKVYRENNKEYYTRKATAHNRLKRGFTTELYNQKLVEQNWACAICGRHREAFTKEFAADHDHTTGKARGLLCSNCNTALGKFNDSIETLQNAIEYLKKYTP